MNSLEGSQLEGLKGKHIFMTILKQMKTCVWMSVTPSLTVSLWMDNMMRRLGMRYIDHCKTGKLVISLNDRKKEKQTQLADYIFPQQKHIFLC